MKYPDTSSLGFKIIKHRKSQCDTCKSRTTTKALSFEKDGRNTVVPICDQDLPKTINALVRKLKNEQRVKETIEKALNAAGGLNKGKTRSVDSLVSDIADAFDSEDSGDECRSDEFSEEEVEEPTKTNNRSRKRLRPARIIDDEEEPQPKRHKITEPDESLEEPYDDDFTGLVEGKDDNSSDESLPDSPSPPPAVVSPIAPSTVSTPRTSELNQLLESLGVSGV